MYHLINNNYSSKITLVSGGVASGKSEFAENIAMKSDNERYYVATMQIWDEEGQARVKKHRKMREGKGFNTIECPVELDKISVPHGSTVLLECMSNLAANECFSEKGFDGVHNRILSGINNLCCTAEKIVIVTNEIFSDGMVYSKDTTEYLSVLVSINCFLADMAEEVIEVVCGYPIYWKGVRI